MVVWGRVGRFPVGFWRSGGVEKEEDGRSNGGSGYWSGKKEFTGGSRSFGCHRWRSGSVGLMGLCLWLDFTGKGNRLTAGKWK
ncbi:hypothetical protein KY285_026268 [Solanum tuberosum]|nr:hypothetical protein KY285_026268 [Solanum tuberosum]